jgi:hypothetical protein
VCFELVGSFWWDDVVEMEVGGGGSALSVREMSR